jgi:hypothetical protein
VVVRLLVRRVLAEVRVVRAPALAVFRRVVRLVAGRCVPEVVVAIALLLDPG